MAYVQPFRALRYDPGRVEIAKAITQPYDKITREMQDAYYAASPYNLVRIILGKRNPSDHIGDNPYSRAAAFFRDWRRNGILLQDATPAIYRYVQRFAAPGTGATLVRQGFIAIGRIESYSESIVFRHEQTLAKPKADRLDLLRATRAHFGQLFMLYSDPEGEIDRALQTSSPPDMDFSDEYGVHQQLWKIADPLVINQVCGAMRDKKLIIADGHHRYETALTYRNEARQAASRSSDVPAPHDFVMMTFVNMDAPGLVILPTHRVVHGLPSFSPDALKADSRRFFSVEEVDPALDPARAVGILRRAGQSGTALLAVTANRAFLFDTPKTFGSTFFKDLSLRQQSLDVVQLHKCLLETVLGLSEESIRNQENISYVRAAGEAIARVRSGGANVAFLMNPVPIRQVRDIAFAGEVLPQKSTDFYPKLLSGLTIYSLD